MWESFTWHDLQINENLTLMKPSNTVSDSLSFMMKVTFFMSRGKWKVAHQYYPELLSCHFAGQHIWQCAWQHSIQCWSNGRAIYATMVYGKCTMWSGVLGDGWRTMRDSNNNVLGCQYCSTILMPMLVQFGSTILMSILMLLYNAMAVFYTLCNVPAAYNSTRTRTTEFNDIITLQHKHKLCNVYGMKITQNYSL